MPLGLNQGLNWGLLDPVVKILLNIDQISKASLWNIFDRPGNKKGLIYHKTGITNT